MFDLKNGFVICSLFLYFVDFISFGELYVTYRLAFGLKTLTSKNSLLARTHEDWYRVWLHYQLQFNVEDIHPLIFVAAVPHAHLYKLLLKKSREYFCCDCVAKWQIPTFCTKRHAWYQTYCYIHNWMVVLWVSNQIWYGSDPRVIVLLNHSFLLKQIL